MHPSSKRILAPLFLLLVTAAIFAPEVRGDGIPMVNFTFSDGSASWFFTLPQGSAPDSVGLLGTDSFEFFQVPVFASFMPANTALTYDLLFFRQSDSANFEMFCAPFIVSQTNPPFFHCDEITSASVLGATAMWSGSPNNPNFIAGVYGGLTISEAPEPSTLGLLLISFATLFLLAAGFRPSHR
jgi:hypothetical protein